jgi:DNA-binding MarR family transcriptional regulator
MRKGFDIACLSIVKLPYRSVLKFDFEKYGSAFLAMRLHRLRVLITDQSEELFEHFGLVAPSSCVSTILFLKERKSASIAQIAKATEYSHQLTSQRLLQLEELGLADRQAHERDGRRVLIALTPAGKKQAARIEEFLVLASKLMDGLFEELGCDLDLVLIHATENLTMNSLRKRASKLNQ